MNIFNRSKVTEIGSPHKLDAFTAFAACALLFLAVGCVSAATFVVSNINDSGPGSLRQAIFDANVNAEDDVINFDAAVFSTPQTITLTSGQLSIAPDATTGSHQLVINGPGAGLLTLDGGNHSRIFEVKSSSATTIDGLKLTHGNGYANGVVNGTPTAGGAIRSGNGSNGRGLSILTLRNSVVTYNTALGTNVQGGNGQGGGILSFGSLAIVNCDFNHNTTSYTGGAIHLASPATIVNSTFDYNTGTFGAAIYYFPDLLAATTIVNSTIAFNSTDRANGMGGLQIDSGNVSLINSIVSNNNIPGSNGDIRGKVSSARNTIIGSTLTSTITNDLGGNLLNIDAKLSLDSVRVPGGNSGLRFSADSPAIDAGSDCVLASTAAGGCSPIAVTTDYRGVARPQDGNGDGTATVDIGDFETTRTEVLSAPTGTIDLQAASDTGISDSDNITSTADLNFVVAGTTAGIPFQFTRDGFVISNSVGSDQPLLFTDHLTVAGRHTYALFRTVDGVMSLAGTQLTVTYDNVAPSASISRTGTQNASTNHLPISFNVIFTEPVASFDQTDISFAGSTANVTAAAVSISGSGPVYTVYISNIGEGTLVFNVPAGAVSDAAGNVNTPSTIVSNTVVYTTMGPTVTINQASSQKDPWGGPYVIFTAVFSSPVTGFTASDISTAGSTAPINASRTNVSGSGTTYQVYIELVTGTIDNKTVVASIIANAAQDAAGNWSQASTSTDNSVTIDNVKALVTLEQASDQADPAQTLPIRYTLLFNRTVTGVTANKIYITGSADVSNANVAIDGNGTGTSFNITVSNVGSAGVVTANLNGQFFDTVGNEAQPVPSKDRSVTYLHQAVTYDYDHDGKSDEAVVRPSDKYWYVNRSQVGFVEFPLGGSSDLLAPADYSGDGRTDAAMFSPSTGTWAIRNSQYGERTFAQLGISGDLPVPADYDGDGKADVAIYRPSEGNWYIQRSTGGLAVVKFGIAEDKPTIGDFDGDGKTDIAVFRPSTGIWYRLNSSDGSFFATQFGQLGDKVVPADYTGDGKTDIAVWRPSDGTWYVLRSEDNSYYGQQFGLPDDLPVPADYDGDGKVDIAVFRPSEGIWYELRSASGFTGVHFGMTGDRPAANAFVY